MAKKLIQVGHSWGLILSKPILELLKINPVLDKVELEVVGNELRIRKAKEEE